MSFFTFKCSVCTFEERIPEACGFYCVPAEKLVIHTTFAWCGACKHIVHAEILPDPAKIRDQYRRIVDRDPATLSDIVRLKWPEDSDEEAIAKELSYVRAQIEWRATRRSPPRCLLCGSTDWIAFDQDTSKNPVSRFTLTHPDCGGSLEGTWSGHAKVRLRDFDGEGSALTPLT